MAITRDPTALLSIEKHPWYEPITEKTVESVQATAVSGIEYPLKSPYYTDTLSDANEAPPQVTLESRLKTLSSEIDGMLSQEKRDVEKLFPMIHAAIMMMMRITAKDDQKEMHEINLKVKTHAHEIKATYNTWQGMSITVLSSSISVAGGLAGLTFTLPASVISAESAKKLLTASHGIGTAGTGIGGIGSIFNNRSEGTRVVLQIDLKRSQDSEEERKGSKHNKAELGKTARAAAEEFARSLHEAKRAAAAA